jgi:hypothetical protein
MKYEYGALVEKEQQTTEQLTEKKKLSQFHCVHRNPHVDWIGIEPRSPR